MPQQGRDVGRLLFDFHVAAAAIDNHEYGNHVESYKRAHTQRNMQYMHERGKQVLVPICTNQTVDLQELQLKFPVMS